MDVWKEISLVVNNMNLAIEYIMREKRARNLLSFPFSLLLTDHYGLKMIVTVGKSYGDSENLMVKHWKMWLCPESNRLPDYMEFSIPKKEIFSSQKIIVPNWFIMPYHEESFETTNYSIDLEENEYNNHVQNFYNTTSHQLHRENWVWSEFKKIHVDESFKMGVYNKEALRIQRSLVKFYSPSDWHTWVYWKKIFLPPTQFAAELVFEKEYNFVAEKSK